MIIELLLFLSLGVLAGIITGILPGIHINLIGSILLSSSFALTSIVNPIFLVMFIVSMSITHVFIDFIPSIYLGAPDDSSTLSILPGHKMLLEGKAHEAIIITLIGSLIGIIMIFVFATILLIHGPLNIITIINSLPKYYISLFLIIISIFLISTEKNKFAAIFIFALAGFLGMASLNLPIKNPLLPLLAGLFGASSMILSIKQKATIPKQEIKAFKDIEISKKDLLHLSLLSSIISILMGIFPTIGANQIATTTSTIKKQDSKQFLFSIGLITSFTMILSFITLFVIQKSRTGSAVFIQQLLNEIKLNQIIFILIISLITGLIAFIIGIKISKIFAENINKINYSKLCFIILLFLFTITFFFSGILGILIFITSISLGIIGNLSNIKRTNLMACLIVPTILLYLF